METIGNFPDLASARVAQSLLDAEGIVAEIPDEHLSGIDWQMNSALRGIRLTVAPEDAAAARELLAELEAADEADLEPGDAPDACPKCSSESVGPPSWKKRMKALSLFFFPALVLYPLFALLSHRKQCYSCGARWS